MALCLHEAWVRTRTFSESAWARTITFDPLRQYHTNKIEKRCALLATLQCQIAAASGDGKNQIGRSQVSHWGHRPPLVGIQSCGTWVNHDTSVSQGARAGMRKAQLPPPRDVPGPCQTEAKTLIISIRKGTCFLIKTCAAFPIYFIQASCVCIFSLYKTPV